MKSPSSLRIEKLARENMESMAGHEVPGWLGFNPAELKATVNCSSRRRSAFDVNTNLIVEFYR